MPQNFDELWTRYDPRTEPLEIETLREWEEEGVVLRVVRYRIGIFKGQRAMMAAVYGCPKGGTNLPGLVQIHGGGQYADYRAPLFNGQRGYATISISWAGRIAAPGYLVNPDIVKLFWDGKTEDPDYKLTTDWGALDGYHAPCRNPKNSFAHLSPAAWTLDDVESPRNSPWFLGALGARRALTFLEQQPEVDPEKLGVYGHSMGGKLTVMTAGADSRVKAAAPSCGGISDRDSDNALYRATIGDDAYLKKISCPIIFLSPANDFHGRIDDLQKAVNEIGSREWRVTCSAHHNHQDTDEFEVASPLWFDQHLKGSFAWPGTPQSSLDLTAADGSPSFTVAPDANSPFLSVDVFYTQQGQKEGEKNDMKNTIARHWHHVSPTKDGDSWKARLPLISTDKPLWVYANVLYPLENPVTGAGYYYGLYTAQTFNLSSLIQVASPEQLKDAGVKATANPSLTIETFEGDWEKEWFTYRPEEWARLTHKVYDDRWKAPPYAKLALEVRSEKPNKLVVGIDEYAAEAALKGDTQWQEIVLFPVDFQNSDGVSFLDWSGIRELRLGAQEILRSGNGPDRKTRVVGDGWKGAPPEFRNLRWVEGTKEELNARRKVKLPQTSRENPRAYLSAEYADDVAFGVAPVHYPRDRLGDPYEVNGKTHTNGMTLHAPSKATFFLGGKYVKFHAFASPGRNATVTFQVIVDDKKVFDSGLLQRNEFREICLPLKDAQELQLVITDGGNGIGGDWAHWVDAWVEGE
ncbi:MAG: NPCBM/NEW2 domain-containing protein [Planctomycetota bacterium]|nr:NPCBM/NEW2 domain-containing protein [Planctomycetota bacterium]